MCGIAGFAGSPRWGDADLGRMLRLLVHRGPDGEGRFLEGGVALGHRRLSILDLETGAQPMTSPCAPVTITFNGEIYNHRELRAQLEVKGHRFRTRSDTEAILHLYEEHGDACVERLRGMFSFALWDARKRRLLAARDRLGAKPFVYLHRPDGAFAFASEIKALLTLPGVERRPDLEALNLYLALQYVPHPWTAFRGILKLPPAHLLTLEDGRLSVRPYWRLTPQEKLDLAPAELDEAIRERLSECVRVRLESDVPLGAFLSGGVDSSAVVAAMARETQRPVRTFCIGFEEAGYDERDHARRAARHLGAEHTDALVRPDAVGILPRLSWHHDEPFADSSAIPTYRLSELTRRHVTVALTGDAGDELFAGYPRYRANLAFGAWKALPGFVRAVPEAFLRRLPGHDEKGLGRMARRFLEVGDADPIRRYGLWVSIFDPARLDALLQPEAKAGPGALDWLASLDAGYEDLVDRMEAIDLRSYLPGALLAKVDTASMAVSLECRSPFLDPALVEFAMRIPSGAKTGLLEGKLCLKRAVSPWLPAENVRRPKMGFGVPVSRWFRRELEPLLRETVLSERALARGLFRPEVVRTLVEEHVTGRAYHAHRLWALLMLERWFETWVDGPDLPERP